MDLLSLTRCRMKTRRDLSLLWQDLMARLIQRLDSNIYLMSSIKFSSCKIFKHAHEFLKWKLILIIAFRTFKSLNKMLLKLYVMEELGWFVSRCQENCFDLCHDVKRSGSICFTMSGDFVRFVSRCQEILFRQPLPWSLQQLPVEIRRLQTK